MLSLLAWAETPESYCPNLDVRDDRYDHGVKKGRIPGAGDVEG